MDEIQFLKKSPPISIVNIVNKAFEIWICCPGKELWCYKKQRDKYDKRFSERFVFAFVFTSYICQLVFDDCFGFQEEREEH